MEPYQAMEQRNEQMVTSGDGGAGLDVKKEDPERESPQISVKKEEDGEQQIVVKSEEEEPIVVEQERQQTVVKDEEGRLIVEEVLEERRQHIAVKKEEDNEQQIAVKEEEEQSIVVEDEEEDNVVKEEEQSIVVEDDEEDRQQIVVKDVGQLIVLEEEEGHQIRVKEEEKGQDIVVKEEKTQPIVVEEAEVERQPLQPATVELESEAGYCDPTDQMKTSDREEVDEAMAASDCSSATVVKEGTEESRQLQIKACLHDQSKRRASYFSRGQRMVMESLKKVNSSGRRVLQQNTVPTLNTACEVKVLPQITSLSASTILNALPREEQKVTNWLELVEAVPPSVSSGSCQQSVAQKRQSFSSFQPSERRSRPQSRGYPGRPLPLRPMSPEGEELDQRWQSRRSSKTHSNHSYDEVGEVPASNIETERRSRPQSQGYPGRPLPLRPMSPEGEELDQRWQSRRSSKTHSNHSYDEVGEVPASNIETDDDSGSSSSSSEGENDCVEHAKPGTGKRNYALNKRQYCFFCGKGQLALPRHLLTVHKNERDIAMLCTFKETNQKGAYDNELTRLRNLGNFKHNVEVLKKGGTGIVVVKRPSKNRRVRDFLPCPTCFGFYYKAELWRHVKKCPLKPDEAYDSKSLVSKSKLLLQAAMIESNNLSTHMQTLLASMHDDDLKDIVFKDEILVQFGEILLQKYGPAKKNDISSRLRQLARLKQTYQRKPGVSSFMDLLCGMNYDLCRDSTYELCGVKITVDGRREFSLPSLALRLGHLLKKVGVVKQGICLRKDDSGGVKEAETFLTLMKNEWTDSISSNALNTLKRRKDNDPENLPLTEDLKCLRNFLADSLPKLSTVLKADCIYSNWRKLAQMVLARLIIFNKRRPMEVAKMLLHAYESRPCWKDVQAAEVTQSLAALERKFLDRLDLLMVPGKKSRKVPILMCPDVAEPLKVLMETRETVGIPNTNPFFFASMSSGGNLDGWQAIHAATSQTTLKKPKLINSTRCRKYAATITQLFDLTTNEEEWLANHMGHSMSIEREFYRLHESTIEITKVGRLLTKMDRGANAEESEDEMNKGDHVEAGESEGEMNKGDHVEAGESEGEMNKGDHVEAGESEGEMNKGDHVEAGESEGEMNKGDHVEAGESEGEMNKGDHVEAGEFEGEMQPNDNVKEVPAQNSTIHTQQDEKIHEPSDEESIIYNEQTWGRKRKKRCIASDSDASDVCVIPQKRKAQVRTRWTLTEEMVLHTAFKDVLKEKMYPRASQIRTLQSKHESMKLRTPAQIKSKLQYLMKKLASKKS